MRSALLGEQLRAALNHSALGIVGQLAKVAQDERCKQLQTALHFDAGLVCEFCGTGALTCLKQHRVLRCYTVVLAEE